MKSLFVLLLTIVSKCIGYSFRNSNTCTHGRVPLMMHPQSSTTQEDEAIEELMKKHDPILLFASKLLDDETARDASALYAWCRRLDEITDDPSSDVATIQQRLSDWESRFDMICRNEPVDDMDRALAMYLQRNDDLELSPFIDMISGMQADSVLNRTISNMAELEEYAYQVAGTVGLMLLPLLNANVEQSRDAAIALGKAIQLINILRDASPDVVLGRVYLPQDMLRAEGVSTEDVLLRKSSPEYRKVVAAVAERAEALLLEAEIGKSTLPGIGPLFVQIIVELYREYLVKLEQIGYDNLNLRGERVKINSIQKLMASVKAAIKVFLTQR
mmetsp:Transcript_3016/g.5089  ORF Transcript_3016/g.5089 Transcript_3016/m.5089 type:complete len:330 (-) Transcript_3016:153-1142(-)